MLRIAFRNLGREVRDCPFSFESDPEEQTDGKTSDPEADWTAKRSKRGKNKNDFFWGYKLHMIVDAVYGIPLYSYTTAGNKNDSPELPKLLDAAKGLQNWLRPKCVIADRGYDSQANHEAVLERGGVLVAPARKPPGESLHEGVYTVEGVPTCIGTKPMEYVLSDPDKGHLYRCRREKCHLLLRKGRRYCNQEYWVEFRPDKLRLFGPIRKDSAEWKDLYGLRQSIERTFKSLKESRRLERHCFRGLRKVSLHAAMSVLGFTATWLAKLQSGEPNPGWMVRKVA